jgi:hypothetical protein
MGQLIPRTSLTVSAANSSGVLTVADTTTVWPTQIGWLSKSGVTSQRLQVVEVIGSTTFRCRILPLISDDNFDKGSPLAYPGSNFSDLSGFDGGSATFSADPQVVRGSATSTAAKV